MQKLVVASLLLAPLVLAGCGKSSSTSSPSSSTTSSSTSANGAPAPTATAVTGTITVPSPPSSITSSAKLEVSLLDVTQQPSTTVNKQDFNPPKFPQAFHIPFTASAINPNDLYVLEAKMQDAGRTYTTKLQQPVLTQGQSAHADLTLTAEPTKAEKMLADFQHAKRQTGGMKVKNHTSKKIGESHSWQVFSNIHGVQFIIEQVNTAKHGFTKTEYAYQSGLPWVVVREHMPKPDAKPTSTEKVGWGDQGVLVLNQKTENGKKGTVSNADQKALNKDAVAEYKRFSKNNAS